MNTPTFFFFRCLHPAFVQACECIYQKPVRSAPLSIVAPAKSGRYINKRDFPGGRKGQKFAFFAKVFFFSLLNTTVGLHLIPLACLLIG